MVFLSVRSNNSLALAIFHELSLLQVNNHGIYFNVNHNKSRLLFSSAEMFKKPLWQTAWTQIRLLL